MRFHSALPPIEASTATPTDTAPRRTQASAPCAPIPIAIAIATANGSNSRHCAPVTTPSNRFQSWEERCGMRTRLRALPMANAVQQASAPTAHSSPNSCRPAEPWPGPASACQPMHTAPAAHSSSDGSNRRSGTAPCSRLPTTVTATGRKPITSEVMAMPPACTALDSSR